VDRAAPALQRFRLGERLRATAIGDFELASGVAANPSLPELEAA
jgi:hypothetical protein